MARKHSVTKALRVADDAILICTRNSWQEWRVERAICFTRRRIDFYNPVGKIAQPTQGQAVAYFGPDVQRFARVFSAIGFILPAGNKARAALEMASEPLAS
jgi:hypothetical protein